MDRQEMLVSREIKRLVPVLGRDTAERINKAYLLGDEDTRKRVFEMLDVIKAAVFTEQGIGDTILLQPPEESVACRGDIEIGQIMYGKKKMYPIKLTKEMFLTHMGIFGSSGFGKTNISYWLIRKLAERNIPVLIFDFSKRNYKDLLGTDLKDRVDIYTIGRNVSPFRFNPLKPPDGISLSQWMKEFSSIFDHAYWLLGGGRHVILKSLDAVHDIVEKPRLSDLKRWIDKHGSSRIPVRERNWVATATRPLESLCFKELGQVFECDEGFRPSDFFRPGRITILELDALDTNDKTFFIEIMLQWIRDWLLVNNKKEELLGTVFLEEAHHILNREKASRLGAETVIDLVFREIRELGLGMVYMDQHPSLVSYPALGNTSTTIYLNLGLDSKQSSDVQDAANMLGLVDEEKGYLRRLSVGEGFMLCRRSDFQEPFLVKFDEVSIQKGLVTDLDIKTHMEGRVPKEVFRYEPRVLKPREGEKELKQEGGKDMLAQEVEQAGRRIIKVLGEGRGAYSSQIYRELKMSGSTFITKVNKLREQGLVNVVNAKIKKNKMCYYFLTRDGEEFFRSVYGNRTGNVDMDMGRVSGMFANAGWNVQKENGRMTISKDGKTVSFIVVDTLDRDGIGGAVRNGGRYLCADETIKNTVLQMAARFSKENGPITVAVTTLKNLEETGKFEKVEFED